VELSDKRHGQHFGPTQMEEQMKVLAINVIDSDLIVAGLEYELHFSCSVMIECTGVFGVN